MKVLLYGRFGQYPAEIEEKVLKNGLEIVKEGTAEAIITYGGDGTLIGAERDHPGIPKLPLLNSERGLKYSNLPADQLLERLAQNRLKIKEFSKIEVQFKDQRLVAANDVVIRNSLPNIALRFKVLANNSELIPNNPELIGDGVVIATTFGSEGYFYSIARRTFENGIGIAFNNLHNVFLGPHILGDSAEIKVEILRGPASLAVDNDPKIIEVKDGDFVVVKHSSQVTKILTP